MNTMSRRRFAHLAAATGVALALPAVAQQTMPAAKDRAVSQFT